jgi:cytochrome c oxidase subunit 2
MLERFTLFPEAASTVAARVDALFFYLSGVSIFFSALIFGLILYFMIKHRRRTPDERGVPVHGSTGLEIIWTAIPFAIGLVAFFWGASIYAALHRPPDDAMEVHVVGKQWMWKLQHMEGRREINTLHVPVGRPVKLLITSEDVIHSFYVPAFRIKRDAVPGRYTTIWFEATKPGAYHLFCAEYCGTLHAGMGGWVIAMDPAAFQAWLDGADDGAAVPVTSAGERVFTAQGCGSCHRADRAARAPMLTAVVGSTVQLADGRSVVADEAYLRESILNPAAKVVAGYEPIMPTYQGLIDEEELLQLISYLKSLQEDDEQEPPS